MLLISGLLADLVDKVNQVHIAGLVDHLAASVLLVGWFTQLIWLT